MKNSYYEDLTTERTDILIHITWTIEEGNPVTTLRAYPVYKGGIRVEGYKVLKRKAHSRAEIEIIKDQLKNSFMQQMKRKPKTESSSKRVDTKLDENTPMVNAFRMLEKSEMLDAKWKAATKKQYLTYFERHILPIIQYCEVPSDFGQRELDELQQALVEDILSHGNSSGILDNAVGGANEHLQQARTIYEFMRTINPFLPEIRILRETKSIRIRSEQPKSLPHAVVVGLRAEIEALLPVNPKVARAAAIMHSGGPRTSESAAVIKSDLVLNDSFVLVIVDYQEQDGKRIPSLKRDSSHRRVVLDEWGSSLVKKANVMIGPEPNTDIAPVTSKELTEWIRTTLTKLGCGEEYWNSAIKDMGSNPEYDKSGAPSTDVAAYILRRDAESRWANICGLSKEEQDIQLGHKRYTKGKKRLKLTDPNVYKTIAMKLKRYNPNSERNTSCDAYNLYHGIDQSIIPFREYSLLNSSCEPLIVTIVMKNAEPGESITVQTDGIIQDSKITVNKDTHSREDTECIGIGQYETVQGGSHEEKE